MKARQTEPFNENTAVDECVFTLGTVYFLSVTCHKDKLLECLNLSIISRISILKIIEENSICKQGKIKCQSSTSVL
jgi:hypothetical protein